MSDKATILRKGQDTRERLLDAATRAVLAKGFAATSIEELIAEVGITKSGFFYHFRDKHGLAKAMLERFLALDRSLLEEIFCRGDQLNEDPLHGFLVGLQLYIEILDQLPAIHPGCIAASFCYQDQLFSREIQELNCSGATAWRNRFRTRLARIAARYPPRIRINLDDLADSAWILVEGGIVLSRLMQDAGVLSRQIRLYRDIVRATFQEA